MLLHRRRSFLFKSLVFLSLVLFSLCLITRHIRPSLVIRDLGYLTRPLWDKPGEQPSILIPHFHSDTLPTSSLCSLHGWRPRAEETERMPRVIDAVIFSIEFDILEIRLRELWDVVDKFVVMEADRTFTGKPKRLFLQENMERFRWAEEKLIVVSLTNVLEEHPKKNFDNEVQMRRNMTLAIKSLLPKIGDLVIVSDVDEIPFARSILLLKSCLGLPPELHLQMRNYLYSFEFETSTTNWKPHVETYDVGFGYHHGKSKESNHTLAQAGWHCSFCFRYLSDFVFKMTSYSHNDRVTGPELLEKGNIQKRICEGSDIFDMFPEAYTFRDLFSLMGNIPRTQSTDGLPSAVLNDKFKFLLPGGCVREDAEF